MKLITETAVLATFVMILFMFFEVLRFFISATKLATSCEAQFHIKELTLHQKMYDASFPYDYFRMTEKGSPYLLLCNGLSIF